MVLLRFAVNAYAAVGHFSATSGEFGFLRCLALTPRPQPESSFPVWAVQVPHCVALIVSYRC